MPDYTSQQAAELRAAIATGALSVSHDGKTVTYRSLDDMRAALRIIEDALGSAARPTRRIHVVGF